MKSTTKAFLFVFCFCVGVFFHSAQAQVITGNVTDESGIPLPGATVVVEGTTNGVSSDFDGNFSIEAQQGQSLIFSFVGYASQTIAIGSTSEINIQLLPDSELDEVVVTALGISRDKKSLGYSVTQVGGDEINTIKDHNVANALVGKVAGLTINQSGSIGSASRITIRGNNSLSGNTQALIVVDGVPINADGVNTGGSVYRSVVTGGGLTDINSSDIESISVLKGPNAAALYGSRAGNGVILITTKKGSESDRLGVTLNSNVTFDNPLFLPEYQNIYGQGLSGAPFTDLISNWGSGSWGSKLDGSSQLYFTGVNKPYSAEPNNVKDFFDTGVKAITSLSLEKGSDNATVRFSYTNNNTESILPNSNLESHNFNLRSTIELSDKLSVDAKATYFSQEVTNRAALGGEGVLAYVYGLPRNVAIQDLENFQAPNPGLPEEFKVISYAGPNASTGNPYWILNHDINDEQRSRFFGFAKINYEFTDWLSAFVRIGSDITDIKRLDVNRPGHHFYASGRLIKSSNTYGELNSEFLITAKKDLTEKINLVVNAGGNLSKRTGEGLTNNGEDFKIPTRVFLANTNIQTVNETPQAIKKVNSLYGTANLAYDNFIYLDLTTRNDWSSTLGEENRSFLYSSLSTSFILNRFIDPEQNFFNLVKLRGSWAEVGNDTDPYQLYQTFSVPGQGFLGLTTLSAPKVKLNPDLKPETVTSIDFGIELSMLENRLSLDVSVYDITTTDLIFDVPVPAATGFSFFKENIGKVTNKGLEITLGVTPIKTASFSWNASINYSKNQNKLIELIDDLNSYTYLNTNSGNLSLRAQVGGGIGDIYGTIWDTNEAGVKLVNANGAPIASTPTNYLGNAQPDWLGGFSNTFTFKDLSLRFLIDGRFGGEIYSQTSAALDASGVSQRSLLYRESGVTLEGINTDTNAPNTASISGEEYWGAYSSIAENYIYDQTNIRLREFAVGYQIPNTKSVGIQSANIQLIGRNLFFLMKKAEDIDPESVLGTNIEGQGINAYNLPSVRSLGLNLTLNF